MTYTWLLYFFFKANIRISSHILRYCWETARQDLILKRQLSLPGAIKALPGGSRVTGLGPPGAEEPEQEMCWKKCCRSSIHGSIFMKNIPTFQHFYNATFQGSSFSFWFVFSNLVTFRRLQASQICERYSYRPRCFYVWRLLGQHHAALHGTTPIGTVDGSRNPGDQHLGCMKPYK